MADMKIVKDNLTIINLYVLQNIFRTCDSPHPDKWQNSSVVKNLLPNLDHLEKSHFLERTCSETKQRRFLQKCDFELLKEGDLISLNSNSDGENFTEDQYCLHIDEEELVAEICREQEERGASS